MRVSRVSQLLAGGGGGGGCIGSLRPDFIFGMHGRILTKLAKLQWQDSSLGQGDSNLFHLVYSAPMGAQWVGPPRAKMSNSQTLSNPVAAKPKHTVCRYFNK